MQQRTFGRTGLSVSPLGFGAAPVGYLNIPQHEITRLLNQLLDSGVNVIDTAASYPGAEEAIGKAIGNRRDEFVLVSKCGQSFGDVPGDAWSAQVITATIERSLARMRTDRLDVMLLHSCELDVLQRGEAIEALVSAREAGKIRHAGYSGDNGAAAWAAAHPELEVLQTSVSITDQHNIDLVLPIAREHNVGVMAKRPIADAAWNPTRPGMYQSYGKVYEDRLKAMNISAEKYRLSWIELALRFTLSFREVSTAIVGTTNLEHARANVGVASQGPLAGDVVDEIRSAFHDADPNGEWLGQT
jgi:aryl-alcohol dehydrogenase-like predicted oxidoreductase